jgi:hypothetical protein
MKVNYKNDNDIFMLERSEWVCYISGDPSRVSGSVTFIPSKGEEPNWFHRQMHWLLLGLKWCKNKS